MRRFLAAALALGAVLLPMARADTPPAADTESAELDHGSFRIYQGSQLLGTEVFSLLVSGDSLLVSSRTFQVVRGDTLRKDVAQVMNLLDYGLRSYRSKEKYAGHTLIRGLVLGDTAFSVYRQVDEQGEGDRLVLPPGRMFVIDPKVFVSFDLMCRSLHGRVFDRRPITLLVLGSRDSVLEATAADLGTDTIRWGSRPVQARKLSIADAHVTFRAWASPGGSLLRLEESTTGLRVERDAPAVKRRAAKPRSGG